MLLHRGGELAEGRRLAVNGIREVAPEALVKCGNELTRCSESRPSASIGFRRGIGEDSAGQSECVWHTAASAEVRAGDVGAVAVEAASPGRAPCRARGSARRRGTRRGSRDVGLFRWRSCRWCRSGPAQRHRGRGRALRACGTDRIDEGAILVLPSRRTSCRGQGAARRVPRKRRPRQGRASSGGRGVPSLRCPAGDD